MSYMEFYLQKLSHENAQTRLRAAKLLASSRNPSALYRLKALLPRETDPEVRLAMQQAIEQLCDSLKK